MKRAFVTLAIVLLFSSGLSAAEVPTATQIVQKAKKECAQFENGQFSSTERAISLYDFTGDGRPEKVVDAAQFSCSTSASMWGGTGGMLLWVVVDGEAREFLAHQWKVVEMGNKNVLLLAVHSSQCSDKPTPCYRAFAWSEDGFVTTR